MSQNRIEFVGEGHISFCLLVALILVRVKEMRVVTLLRKPIY